MNAGHWAQNTFDSPYLPLTDTKLREWWLQDDMRQLKLRSKFADPWHPHLFPENVSFQATFRDEAPCPICGTIAHLDAMQRDGALFTLPITCPNGHPYLARYDASTLKMVTEAR